MRLSRLVLAAGLTLAGLGAAPALADRLHDRVTADSFGNLVVWSRAGYKRIVVGKGHLAGQLGAYVGEGEGADGKRNHGVSLHGDRDEFPRYGDCYRPAVLVKGRSYMYGLADGELPILTGSCHPSAN